MVPRFRRVVLGCVVSIVVAAHTAGAQEPLTFFKNYFITGDYVVRGASLWRKGIDGVAKSTIAISGVPEDDVDVVAAFLYVQTAESVQWSGIDHAKFRGNDLGAGNNSYARALNWDSATPPCWSFLWPGTRRVVTYRADVLRWLPIKANGKIGVNGLHSIQVPDSRRVHAGGDDEDDRETPGEFGPRAVGASLVIVYRDPRQPLKSIVIYDGGFTKRAFAAFTQNVQGFYEASATSPAAKMTHIVGDGSALLSEKVFLNNTLVGVNSFAGTDGLRWDDRTFANLPVPGHASSVKVSVTPFLVPDCLTWSALVFSTEVQDSDGDGLLDIWESSAATLFDPNGQPLPNLHAMGADPHVKDLFAEIAYMYTSADTIYGTAAEPTHSHLPPYEALKMVGDAFKNAPTPINVHFDVGNNYQPNPGDLQTPYIVQASLARGGRNISETRACPDPSDPALPPVECSGPLPGQYPLYPGTVGWKTGFRFLRDEILGFDRNRKDTFRYILFAHSLGMPVEPCLNADGTTNVSCQEGPTANPNFHVPRTNSGIADFPGGDLLVTLGAFHDGDGKPVGSAFMQASTIMHEWGHNLELTHAGAPQIPREPNCKPNYLSVMNYLFQLRGLPDVDGIPRMDYSRDVNGPLNEFSLVESPLASQRYRTGWYVPKATSYVKTLGKAALKHCDGSDLSQTEIDDIAAGGGMVRVDAPNVSGAIDWNGNGSVPDTAFTQDIDFNGVIDGDPTRPELKASSNDWDAIHLNQLGGRRNVGGYYVDTHGRNAVGPLSLDVGRGDIGRGDIGRGDIGRGDIGRGDIGRGDIGRGDIGRGDIGRGDIGRGDIGRGYQGGGDLDVGGANEPAAELDLETAKAVSGNTPDPPNGLTACLTGADFSCGADGGDRPVRLTWQAPHLGRVVRYFVYRVPFTGEAFVPPVPLPTDPIAIVDGIEGAAPTGYFDFDAPLAAELAYFVTAQFDDGVVSGISNFATVTTPTPMVLDFEPFAPRPSVFSSADAPFTYGNATFSGGQLLQHTTNLPVDNTVVYGTTVGCAGCRSEITIAFAQKVSNFSVFLMNGRTVTITYTVEDDAGGSQDVTLVRNLDSGAATIALPDRGISQVVISTGDPFWDFLIDNVQFDAR